MARLKYHHSTPGIVEKLKAAGLAKPREKSVIQGEIERVENMLRVLRREYVRAVSRESMLRARSNPGFEERRRAGFMRMIDAGGFAGRPGKSDNFHKARLPVMTLEQRRIYEKLRWKHKQPRESALAAVFG